VGYIVEGQFRTALGRRRMENRIEKLEGHFILEEEDWQAYG